MRGWELWSDDDSRFGRWSLVSLLLIGAFLMHNTYQNGLYAGQKWQAVTIIGWLPEWIIAEPLALTIFKIGFLIAAPLWALHRGVPYTSWIATVSFTLYWCFYLENIPYWDHQAGLYNLILVVYCVAYHFRRDAMESFPGWVTFLAVFSVASVYWMSGLSKLLASGPAWADGLSLQMFILILGEPDSALGSFLVERRDIAQFLQCLILLIECSAPLILFSRVYRSLVSLTLCSFHLANIFLFHWVDFTANMVILVLFCLIHPWLPRRSQ